MRFIGHRGASHVFPENTCHAIRSALQAGLGFECDLQVLRDGNVVILHDDTLARTAVDSPDGALLRTPIGELTLAQVRAVRVGDASHSEPVPLFTDVIREVMTLGDSSAAHCFAELKSDESPRGAPL